MFTRLPRAGWQPLAKLPFLLIRAAHHPPDGGLRRWHTAADKFSFPFQLFLSFPIEAIFTTARETTPLQKDVEHRLRQEGIFPLSAAGHLPGISAGTGTASAGQQMRQLHTGHQSHPIDSTDKLRAEDFTAFQKQSSVFPVSLSHCAL